MKLKIPGKHHKALLWGGIAVAVVVLILLARRSSSSPTMSTLGGNTPTSGGGATSDAQLQAKSQAFGALTNLLGQQQAAELQSKTTLALASIQAQIEESRLASTLGLAKIQGDYEDRRAAAAETASKYQTDAQFAAASQQTHAQESAQTLNFLSGVVNTAGQVIAAAIAKGKGRGGSIPSGNYPGSTAIYSSTPGFYQPAGGWTRNR